MAASTRPRGADLIKRMCLHCVYLMQPEPLASYRDILPTRVIFPLCAHHAQNPGVIREVHPAEGCRTFRARRIPAERPDPVQPLDSDIRYIPLTKRQVAIIDAADYEWLSKHKWFAQGGRGGRVYAARNHRGKTIMMHREIMRAPKGMVVDHIDHNALNNRRDNLRVCTIRENTYNRRSRCRASKLTGVYPHGNKWKARIERDGERFYLGLFDNKVEAARARDRKAVELFGPFAYLNFPQEHQTPDPRPKTGGNEA